MGYLPNTPLRCAIQAILDLIHAEKLKGACPLELDVGRPSHCVCCRKAFVMTISTKLAFESALALRRRYIAS
jgi:hypothetical protein